MPKRPQSHTLQKSEPRASASARGYDHEWRKFREWYANVKPAICVRCEAALESKLMHLDHIIPIEQGGARLDENNVQWLCETCHNEKTANEDNGFGRLIG
jgi:5-methylcytosine-specific restriction protein A